MSGHTPGPWEVLGSEYDGTLYVMPAGVSAGRGGNRTVAVIPEWTENRDANARLIDAAPELLEALKEVFVIGEKLVDDVYGYEFRQMAKAAIAKATGEGA